MLYHLKSVAKVIIRRRNDAARAQPLFERGRQLDHCGFVKWCHSASLFAKLPFFAGIGGAEVVVLTDAITAAREECAASAARYMLYDAALKREVAAWAPERRRTKRMPDSDFSTRALLEVPDDWGNPVAREQTVVLSPVDERRPVQAHDRRRVVVDDDPVRFESDAVLVSIVRDDATLRSPRRDFFPPRL